MSQKNLLLYRQSNIKKSVFSYVCLLIYFSIPQISILAHNIEIMKLVGIWKTNKNKERKQNMEDRFPLGISISEDLFSFHHWFLEMANIKMCDFRFEKAIEQP